MNESHLTAIRQEQSLALKRREVKLPEGTITYSLLSNELAVENEYGLPAGTILYSIEVRSTIGKYSNDCLTNISYDLAFSEALFDAIADGAVTPFELREVYAELEASL